MVTKRKCNFCSKDIEAGTGKMLIDATGAVSFYCSSKCEKCVGLKRSARKIKWTQTYLKEKAIRVQHLAEERKAAPPEKKAEPKAAEEPKAKAEEPKHKAEKPAAKKK